MGRPRNPKSTMLADGHVAPQSGPVHGLRPAASTTRSALRRFEIKARATRSGDHTSVLFLLSIIGLATLASVPNLQLHVRQLISGRLSPAIQTLAVASTQKPPFPLAGAWRDIGRFGATLSATAESGARTAEGRSIEPEARGTTDDQSEGNPSRTEASLEVAQLFRDLALESTSAIPQAAIVEPKEREQTPETIAVISDYRADDGPPTVPNDHSTDNTAAVAPSVGLDASATLPSETEPSGRPTVGSQLPRTPVEHEPEPMSARTSAAKASHVAALSTKGAREKRGEARRALLATRTDNPTPSGASLFRDIDRARP